jgi:hypothetical protein
VLEGLCFLNPRARCIDRGSGIGYRGRKISNRTGSACTKKRSTRPALPRPDPAPTCRPDRPIPSGEERPGPVPPPPPPGRPVFSPFLSGRNGLSQIRQICRRQSSTAKAAYGGGGGKACSWAPPPSAPFAKKCRFQDAKKAGFAKKPKGLQPVVNQVLPVESSSYRSRRWPIECRLVAPSSGSSDSSRLPDRNPTPRRGHEA